MTSDNKIQGKLDGTSLDDDELQALLEQVFERDEKVPRVDMLQRVQGKLREESGGKFFGEGWSTTRYAPVSTFLVTSLMIVAVLVITFSLIIPIIPDPLP